MIRPVLHSFLHQRICKNQCPPIGLIPVQTILAGMSYYFWYILCVCIIQSECTPRGVQQGVMENGRQGNAGFKLRLTQTGANYMESLANKAMQEQLPGSRLDDVHVNVREGYLDLTDMKITQCTAPEKHSITFKPPDRLVWSARNAEVSVHGDFSGKVEVLLSKIHVRGNFDADATGVNMQVSFSLYKTDDEKLAVRSGECTADVDDLTANMKGLALAVLSKKSIIRQMKPVMASEMCKTARRLIDDDMNKKLATMPKKLPLNKTRSDLKTEMKKTNNNDLAFFTSSLAKHLILDYSTVDGPSVASNYVESYCRGEISYDGVGGTPFHPPPLWEPTPVPTDRMLYIIISDYVMNSLFWHAWKHGLLTWTADGKQLPDYKFLLKTSCENDFLGVCLGTVVPEMGKTFPNSDVQIVFQALQAPAVYFKNSGKVKLVAPSFVTAYAQKGNDLREMMTADLYVEGQVKAWIEDLTLKSNGTITKFNMTLKRNNLNQFNQAKLNEFANMAKGVFQELVNKELMRGLPLPTVKGANVVNPKLKVFERTVRIETDATMEQSVLSNTRKQ